MTAVSTRCLPESEAFLMNVLSMPFAMLPPTRLFTRRTSLSMSRSFRRLFVVVLPFVPETNTTCLGLSMCAKNAGSIFSAI